MNDAERRIVHEVVKSVSLRTTHPNLFRALLTVAIMQVGLAANFFARTPAFIPYGMSRYWPAGVFLVIGVSQIVVLTMWHNLRGVRMVAAWSLAVMLCWGIVNTRQAFEGQASFQLPIVYLGLGALQLPLLIEPRFNPLTANGNGKKLNGNNK